jgi:hypothetical protein
LTGAALALCGVLGSGRGALAAEADSTPQGNPTPAEAIAPNPTPGKEPSPWHLDVMVGTVIPMDVGGRFTLEGPYRIRLSLGAGIMPDSYVSVINSTAEELNLYREAQSRLIENALYRSTTLRAALGWIPWSEWGFFFDVGYAFQGLGGRSSPGEVVVAATDLEPPISGIVDLDVQANLHIMTVDLGYKWFFWENLFLQASLGGEFTMGATSRIEPEFGLRSTRLVDRFAGLAEDKLNNLLEDNVHHPTISILIGARGF